MFEVPSVILTNMPFSIMTMLTLYNNKIEKEILISNPGEANLGLLM